VAAAGRGAGRGLEREWKEMWFDFGCDLSTNLAEFIYSKSSFLLTIVKLKSW